MVPKMNNSTNHGLHNNRKQAVAYIRISSQKQVNNESPVTQRNAIQAYADAHDIEIVEWFEDIARSGKDADRDGLQDLLKYCGRHRSKIDHWIVYNMRRASRDTDSYSGQVRSILKALGISIRSATEAAVDDTREGRFMENLLVALAQLDNEGKSDVTKDNMRALAMQGWWLGAPILGYNMTKKKNDLGKLRSTIKPNAMAPVVKKVLERFSEGDMNKAELTRYAATVGLRSRYGKTVSEDRIYKLLKHPGYAGFIANNHTSWELVPGRHEPIISRDTYNLNQTLLYGKRKRVGEVRQKLNPEFPLKGLLKCPHCKNDLYGSSPRAGSGSRSPRYHCSRKSCKGLYKSTKASVMHEDFIRTLQRIKPSEELLTLYKEVLVAEAARQLGGLNNKVKRQRDELDRIADSRLSAIKKFNADQLTTEEKTDLINALDEEKIAISEELQRLEAQQSIREADIAIALDVMRDIDKQWDIATPQSKQRFQSILFPRGVVYDYKNHRFGTSEMSPLYRVLSNKKDLPVPEKSFLVAGVGFEPTTFWL